MYYEELKQRIRERAHALWEADGCPEGREWDYWLIAEQEIVNESIAGEEDPLEALDHETPKPSGKREGG
jgi:hypothetical protein